MHPKTSITGVFSVSAASLAQCPRDDVVEVAFAGRSNAGKSSALNRLLGSKRLARVSKTPGRTRLLNLFTTSIGIRVVDLPGYGFARASRQEQVAWNAAVNTYLEKRENLHGLVLVVDARHAPKEFDLQMLEWGHERAIPVHVLLNKADKLKRSAQHTALRKFVAATEPYADVSVQLFSATHGLGSDEASKWLCRFTPPIRRQTS